jgi:uncharacterized damage-inducible protein DinB
MILPEYAGEMAAYNEWQNEVLYRLCADLDDGERKRDRGMFFRSIHDTLDHILLIDRLILRYLDDGAPPPMVLERQFDDFAALRAERVRFDAALRERATAMTAGWLSESLDIWSDRLGRRRQMPRGFMLTQMFNHQTHHRSQVTTHLHLAGVDYGSTDLPYNPKSKY